MLNKSPTDYGFTVSDHEPFTLEEAVGQTVGAASTCWTNLDGAGVFRADDAKVYGDNLVAFIREEIIPWATVPNLGLATTAELIEELGARVTVAAANGEAWPDYRTVDSE